MSWRTCTSRCAADPERRRHAQVASSATSAATRRIGSAAISAERGWHSVKAYRDASEPGLEALLAAIQDFRVFHEALSAFADALDLGGNAAVEEGVRTSSSTCSAGTSSACAIRGCIFWMQVFSFAEDITSPFADPAGRSRRAVRPVAAADDDRSLDQRAWFELVGYLDDAEGGVRERAIAHRPGRAHRAARA